MGFIDYTIQDLAKCKSRIIEPRIKIEIFTLKDEYVDTITGGITGGNLTINSESDVRRTFSLNLIPNDEFDISIKENNYIWLDKKALVYLGLHDELTHKDTWYKQGVFLFSNSSVTYDATNNQLTVQCNDLVSLFDGTKSGEYGAYNTVIPAYYDTKYYINNINVNFLSNTTYYSGSISSSSYKINWEDGDIICINIPQNGSNYGKTYLDITITESSQHIGGGQCLVCKDITYEPIENNTMLAGHKYLLQIHFNPRTNVNYYTLLGECNDTNVIYSDGGSTTYYMSYHRIRDVVISILKQLAHIPDEKYMVDEIGEYKAMPGHDGYNNYRISNKLWNAVPFDQEFSIGSTIWQLLTTFRDLYPNYEMYFDVNGNFVCGMKPDQVDDPICINNEYLQDTLISENYTTDLSSVRNIALVYGESIATDYYANTNVLFQGDTYTATIDGYGKTDNPKDKDDFNTYFNGDLIAIRIPVINPNSDVFININNFGKVLICDDSSDMALRPTDRTLPDGQFIKGFKFVPNETYVFKIKKWREDETDKLHANLLGNWQAAGLCALVDKNPINIEKYTKADGTVIDKYSIEYFKEIYNVEHINLVNYFDASLDSSPYTCEKLGELLKTYSGGEFENIDSCSDALERAKWELYNTARLTDNITIQIKYSPFINDVNFLVDYKRSDYDTSFKYLCTNVSHDFYGGTTTLNLVRMYNYYINDH